jgi:IS66 C-terminal element/Transposase IS66 family
MVQPGAMADATLQTIWFSGQLQGVMRPTTPMPSLTMRVPPRWCSNSKFSRDLMVASRWTRPAQVCASRGQFIDGRIEIDSNIVERAIRPIALNRKNALFAGSDGGGEHWAILASLIETCKLNGIDPQAYLADILAGIANDRPINRIDELLPWVWAKNH